ncbi:MAG TPA: bifunctional UDP-N-acetylglucosamine diphosphorylase/glucosamine-1-phosphate N-acetyltransferase GlmU [Thermomicrobiales bacterium]|nr:bifunctional UDP-N-acetylglucosamine diphosphorylase/glucosamine-1-phosphate N-acetyltransferase GlmU [Thermomicrobiales bacterium]
MDPDGLTNAVDPLPPGSDAQGGAVAVTILTAGRGTRMRSTTPKALHPLVGLPMVEHVLRAAQAIEPCQIVVTLGPASEALRERVAGQVDIAWQQEARGTGDAVRVALPVIDPAVEWVVVIFGDHPLVDGETLRRLVSSARQARPILASVAVVLDDPGPYGRYRREGGRVAGVVEAREDPNTYDGPIPVNSGMCCIRRDWLATAIERIPRSPSGEYYLTSLVELAAATEWPVDPVLLVEAPPEVAYGINDRVELAAAEAILRRRINERHMRAGVTLVDPTTTYIDADVRIGADTRVEPGCVLRGATTIGGGCVIGHGSTIEDSRLGDDVSVRGSWIAGAEIGDAVDIGPYAHLRPGTRVAARVHIGNYVELKNASIGSGTQIGHVSYLGDAEVGERVNVGAGTITCNYDGREKHWTTIGDDVFIGSDTMLVAPVTLGAGSSTGAGAVVNRSVEPGKLVVGIPARVIRSRRAERSGAVDAR